MRHYLGKAKELAKFKTYEIQQVPIEENSNVDALAKLVSSKDSKLLGAVLIKELGWPSIDNETDAALPIQEGENWMTSIIKYLLNADLPEDRVEARRINYRAARYLLYDGLLY